MFIVRIPFFLQLNKIKLNRWKCFVGNLRNWTNSNINLKSKAYTINRIVLTRRSKFPGVKSCSTVALNSCIASFIVSEILKKNEIAIAQLDGIYLKSFVIFVEFNNYNEM